MDKLSYYHCVGKEPLKYYTLGQLVQTCASKYGDIVAVDSVEQKKSLTFLEALQEADQLAVGLLELGMQKGDKLGLWAPNCIEWYVINLASVRAGFVLVPLNSSDVATDILYSIKKVAIKIIICPLKGKYNDCYDSLMEVVVAEMENDQSGLANGQLSLQNIVLISDEKRSNAYTYKEVVEMGKKRGTSIIDSLQKAIIPEDICYIHFSSGTTGKPKAVVLNHFQCLNKSYIDATRMEYDQKHNTVCVIIPLFHVFATVITIAASLHFGTTLVLPSVYYCGTKNLEAIERKKCSFLIGTATMLMDIIDIQKVVHKKLELETVLLGAAPCSPELYKEIFSVLGVKQLKMSYGLTETSAAAFMSIPGEKQRCDHVGSLCDHQEVKVVDKYGKVVPFGEPGEVVIRGYCVTPGYFNDDEYTKTVISCDGWFKTGDIGILKSGGYILVLARVKDMILRGGENVYPKEVEDFLCAHPSIKDIQVVAAPHKRLGEEVCACVILKNGCTLSISELSDFCKKKIARHKVPTKLVILKDFPKTLTGKVQKNVLKEKIFVMITNGLL